MSDNATRAPCTVPPLVRWLLRRICRKLVVQGPEHAGRIAEYYRIMREAAESEFTEDNHPTLTAFLRECWDTANVRVETSAVHDEVVAQRGGIIWELKDEA